MRAMKFEFEDGGFVFGTCIIVTKKDILSVLMILRI